MKHQLKLEIIQRNIFDITPYANNPRINKDSVDSLVEAITNFGFLVPIILDNNNVIVTGHTRLLAAKKIGLKEVPCINAEHLTESQIKQFRLVDNKIAEMSSWDIDKLGGEISETAELGIDFKGFKGFR